MIDRLILAVAVSPAEATVEAAVRVYRALRGLLATTVAGRKQPPHLPSSDEHESNVFRHGPFRFFFFSREEERLHIHVQSADGEAKVWIEPEVELARNHELSDQDLSRVLQLVKDHEQEIRDAWHRHFDS